MTKYQLLMYVANAASLNEKKCFLTGVLKEYCV